jgi:putative membrane protein
MASLGLSDLPHVLAMLNGASLVLMTAGYINIRQGRKGAHRGFMAGALGVSVAFMAVYLTYHFSGGVARFGGEGAVRIVYFAILISHIVLAAVIAVLVPVTAVLAFRGRFDQHRRFARRTLPVWFYVAASGLVVYTMTVHLFPYSDTGGLP